MAGRSGLSRTRRVRGLFVAVLGLVLLSACEVEIDVVTEVEEDGSGEMAVTVMLGETVRETLREKALKGDDPTELAELRAEGEDVFARGPQPIDLLEETVPAGWTAERVTDGPALGLRLRAEFADVREIPALLAPFDDWGDELVSSRGSDAERAGVAAVVRDFAIERDGPVFTFSARPDVTVYEGADGGANRLLAGFTVSLRLPGGIRDHDADEEDDGALIWRIPPGTSRTISATSDLTYEPSTFPTVPIVAGGSVAGLAGVLMLRRFRGRRGGPGSGEPPGPTAVTSDVPTPV